MQPTPGGGGSSSTRDGSNSIGSEQHTQCSRYSNVCSGHDMSRSETLDRLQSAAASSIQQQQQQQQLLVVAEDEWHGQAHDGIFDWRHPLVWGVFVPSEAMAASSEWQG